MPYSKKVYNFYHPPSWSTPTAPSDPDPRGLFSPSHLRTCLLPEVTVCIHSGSADFVSGPFWLDHGLRASGAFVVGLGKIGAVQRRLGAGPNCGTVYRQAGAAQVPQSEFVFLSIPLFFADVSCSSLGVGKHKLIQSALHRFCMPLSRLFLLWIVEYRRLKILRICTCHNCRSPRPFSVAFHSPVEFHLLHLLRHKEYSLCFVPYRQDFSVIRYTNVSSVLAIYNKFDMMTHCASSGRLFQHL